MYLSRVILIPAGIRSLRNLFRGLGRGPQAANNVGITNSPVSVAANVQTPIVNQVAVSSLPLFRLRRRSRGCCCRF